MVDTTEVSWLNNTIVRGFLGRALDGLIYWLLGLTYKIFFNVASAELFTNETIKNFYGRVQLILGVFMIFKLAVAIIKGIVNPDSITDKNNGIGNIVTRIIFTLVMLTLIVPINIPNPTTEYDKQLNNNGLLFGTLYSLQNRILSNNTVGRLILGTSDGMRIRDDDGSTLSSTDQKLDQAANLFTSTILKGFIRINLKAYEDDQVGTRGSGDEQYDETNSANWACPEEIDEEILKNYTNLTAEPGGILALTSIYCDSPSSNWWQKLWGTNEMYAFAYKWGISAIVGGIFVFIIVSFTIDVAVRAIKLAVLRLIAPIPIISYMDPSGQKKMFDSWVKNLTSTYIDLFVRLAIIYFVIFLVQDIIVNGIVVNQATGPVGIFTYIFIFIGLFVFAKQAPKFFRDLFGMKESSGLFSGFGEMLGVGAVAAGAISGAQANYKSSLASDIANGKDPNVAKAALSAITGIGGGAFAAGKAAYKAKDHAGQAALDATFKRNNNRMALAESGSTMTGRMQARVQRAFTGETLADTRERKIKALDAKRSAIDKIVSYADGKAKTTNWTTGSASATVQGRNVSVSGNYQAWTFAKSAAESEGRSSFTFNGNSYTLEEANALDFGLMKDNSTSYIQHAGIDPSSGEHDYEFDKLSATMHAETGHNLGERDYASRGDLKKRIGDVDAEIKNKSEGLGTLKANRDATKSGK